ncbi:MAG: hypothetical protein ABIT71_16085, partial [Vicinamibacteraceae bacterium]
MDGVSVEGGEIDGVGPGEGREIAGQPGLFRRDRRGRARAGDGAELRRDGRIERARGIGEGGLECLRREVRGVSGGVDEGGRNRGVATEGGDAGEPAQGGGYVVGGGQSVPENQRVSLVAAALSRA